MSTKLILVRHGETEWNALGKFQGCKDINLSKEGIFQAGFLKEKFNDSFDCIYTSPLKRAVETANIICANSNINPIIEDDLREINFGQWEGLTISEIEHLYPEDFTKWKTDEISAPLCGGDLSIQLASIRAKNAILKIISNHINKTIVVVAHGGIIKAALIGLFNFKMTMYHQMILGNTAVSQIYFDDKLIPKLINLNDTSHLPNNYNLKSFV